MNTVEFYNLSVEMRAILAFLEDSGGEFPSAEVEAHLARLGLEAEQMVVQLALACRELNRTAEAIEAEEHRLAARKRAKRATEAFLRGLIVDHMKATETHRVRSDLATVSLCEGAETFSWDGKDDHIPEEYRVVLTEYRLDKDKVRRDLADGVPLPEGIRGKKTSYVRIL